MQGLRGRPGLMRGLLGMSLAEAIASVLATVKMDAPVGHQRSGKWPGYRPPRGKTYKPNGARECARRRRQMAAIAVRRVG